MSKEITVTNENQVQIVDDKMLLDFMKAFGLTNKLSDNEAKQFMEVSKAYQLNPFKKEIYCVPYGEGKYRKLSIITGYETYIKRAEMSGKLAGWKVWTEGKGNELRAIIEIERNDWTKPFKHEVLISEYRQQTKIWKEKPVTMLKKVVIGQGFRLAFSSDVGGMPYTNDELPQEMTEAKVIDAVEPVVIPREKVVEKKEEPKTEGKKKGNASKFIKYTKEVKTIAELDTIETMIPRNEWTKKELEEIKAELKKAREVINTKETISENDDVSIDDVI